MDHANEVALALQKAGAEKLPTTATAYLYQRLSRGVDLDRRNLGGLQTQGFGRAKGAAVFTDLDAGARALVATSFRAAPRAWGDVTDDELAHLGRYPLRAVVAGTAMDPDDALKKYHGLTPDAALAAGWTRVEFPGSAKMGWAPPGSNAPFGPVGPPERIPIPVRDGGIAYLSFADAERAGAVRKDNNAWDLSGVRPIEQANLFPVQEVSLGAWKHAVAGGLVTVFVIGAGVAAAWKYGVIWKPCSLSTAKDPPPVSDSPTGKWVWLDNAWYPGPGYACLDGKWQFRLAPGSTIAPRHPVTTSVPDDTGPVQTVPPGPMAPTKTPGETPAQSQHSPSAAELEEIKNQTLAFQGVAGVGDAPPILPELDITFRGLVADWEGFDRIGVGVRVLPFLAPDAAAWRAFRDAWKAGTIAPADIVPGLQTETARATKIRQALRDAAVVDPALQLAVSASNAKAWIDSIPWLAWIFQPTAGTVLGKWRVPIVLGGIVVALMILSAVIKGRRGTKIYMLPPPRSG